MTPNARSRQVIPLEEKGVPKVGQSRAPAASPGLVDVSEASAQALTGAICVDRELASHTPYSQFCKFGTSRGTGKKFNKEDTESGQGRGFRVLVKGLK